MRTLVYIRKKELFELVLAWLAELWKLCDRTESPCVVSQISLTELLKQLQVEGGCRAACNAFCEVWALLNDTTDQAPRSPEHSVPSLVTSVR